MNNEQKETRVAVIAIVLDNNEFSAKVNELLHLSLIHL